MGSTPKFGFPFPDDTDLVIQAPQQFENLADAVETKVDQVETDLGTVEANSKLASNVIDGTFALARIPLLPASQTNQGTFAVDRIPTLPGSKIANGFTFAGTRYFTTSGTFSKANPLGTGDIGLRAVDVEVVGGGGAGAPIRDQAGRNPMLSGGGGAGGYARKFILASALGASETVTRGGGGGVGIATANPGETSSFGSHCSATGGAGAGIPTLAGTGQVNRAGGGGVGSGGDLNIQGQSGSVGGGDPSMTRVAGGSGGSSLLGGGGLGGSTSGDAAAGGAGGQYGGGGGGAARLSGVTRENGGAGAVGVVVVHCYV